MARSSRRGARAASGVRAAGQQCSPLRHLHAAAGGAAAAGVWRPWGPGSAGGTRAGAGRLSRACPPHAQRHRGRLRWRLGVGVGGGFLRGAQQPGPGRATAQRRREEFGRNAEANFSPANLEILFRLEQSVPRREGLGCEHLSVEDTGCCLCTRPPLHALRPAARPVIRCLLLLYRHLKNGTKEGALAEN